MSSQVSQILNLLIAPAAFITAQGIIMRFNNERLAQIIARIRQFDEELQHILEIRATKQLPVQMRRFYDKQIRNIKYQAPSIIKSGKRLQTAIFCYELSIILFAVTGLVAGLIFVAGAAFPIALLCSGLALTFLLAGIIHSMRDLTISLSPINYEFNEMIDYAMEHNRQMVYEL
jgi:hypothetical protein